MSFLNKIKALFFGTKEDVEKEIKKEKWRDKIASGENCYLCGEYIEKSTGTKVAQWKVHHKCLRQAKKQVRKMHNLPSKGRWG